LLTGPWCRDNGCRRGGGDARRVGAPHRDRPCVVIRLGRLAFDVCRRVGDDCNEIVSPVHKHNVFTSCVLSLR
jgi:hypothetical protein